MLDRTTRKSVRARRGAAVVELAIVLPVLTFLFLVAIDYCRIFFASQVVDNCARNGAIYAGDPLSSWHSIYPDVDTAAKADADSTMQSQLTVTTTYGTDTTYGNWVKVTVSYPFKTFTSYPGLPSSVTITRSVQTRLAPATPN